MEALRRHLLNLKNPTKSAQRTKFDLEIDLVSQDRIGVSRSNI